MLPIFAKEENGRMKITPLTLSKDEMKQLGVNQVSIFVSY